MTCRFAAIAVLAALTAGCSLFGGGEEEDLVLPNELTEFDATIDPDRVWSTSVGDGVGEAGVRLQIAYADGSIFAANHKGSVFAFDAETGRRQWEEQLKVAISGGPSANEGLVVVGSLDGEVVALEATSGTVRWRAEVSSEVLAPAAFADETVIVRALDGRVYGLDRDSGVRTWIFDRSVPLLSLRGNGPPLTRAGVSFVGYDGGIVVGLNASDGTARWETTVSPPEGRTELERMSDIDGRMAIVAPDLYVVGFQGRVASLTIESGRVLWVKDMSSFGGLSVARTRLFLSDTESNVWGLDRRNGGTLWKQDKLLNRSITSPTTFGDYVVVGDFEGYLHWMNVEDGSLAGRARVDKSALRSQPLTIGNTLYAISAEGTLVAFKAS